MRHGHLLAVEASCTAVLVQLSAAVEARCVRHSAGQAHLVAVHEPIDMVCSRCVAVDKGVVVEGGDNPIYGILESNKSCQLVLTDENSKAFAKKLMASLNYTCPGVVLAW